MTAAINIFSRSLMIRFCSFRWEVVALVKLEITKRAMNVTGYPSMVTPLSAEDKTVPPSFFLSSITAFSLFQYGIKFLSRNAGFL